MLIEVVIMVFLDSVAIINYIKNLILTAIVDGKKSMMISLIVIGLNFKVSMTNQVTLIFLLEALCKNHLMVD